MNRSSETRLSHYLVGLVTLLASMLAASGCAAAADGGGNRMTPALHPGWQAHMSRGLDAWESGDLETAASHYRQAVHVARDRELPAEELAFCTYRLAEAIRVRPETSRGEAALGLLEESRRHFQAAYGGEHPVLIPVWVRIAQLRTQAGDAAGAAAARTRADRIALRSFPESHFLRERYGAARPGLMLHPLEVLQLLHDRGDARRWAVQGS